MHDKAGLYKQIDAEGRHQKITSTEGREVKGAQSLFRALAVLEEIAHCPADLDQLANRLGLSRSTCHRICMALVQRRYLRFRNGEGYTLGPRLVHLGVVSQSQNSLIGLAKPFLEELSEKTGDTVHLAVLEGDQVIFVDKISGSRRFEFRSRIGEQFPVALTAVGKALIFDQSPDVWKRYYEQAAPQALNFAPLDSWIQSMQEYRDAGYALDNQESDESVRCVGSPIRSADNSIVAALSVTSTTNFMDEDRVSHLGSLIRETAEKIGMELGRISR